MARDKSVKLKKIKKTVVPSIDTSPLMASVRRGDDDEAMRGGKKSRNRAGDRKCVTSKHSNNNFIKFI